MQYVQWMSKGRYRSFNSKFAVKTDANSVPVFADCPLAAGPV